jgi:hypothetical protein
VGVQQFMRIETFGRSPRRGDQEGRSVSEILREPAQAPLGLVGLAEVEALELIQGAAPQSLAPEAQKLATTAVDSLGRKLRSDAPILVAGVASYPVQQRMFERNVIEREVYGFWHTKVVRWLQDTFGMSLRSVVARHDENYRHLHFFTLPSQSDDLRLDWRRAHPGLAAKRQAEQAGATRQEQEREFRLAMRRIDDRFYEEVIKDLGRDRFEGARRTKPAGTKSKRLEAQATERQRMLEAAVESVSAELETERAQSETTKKELNQALERLAAAERRARLAEAEIARLKAAR